MNTTAPVIPISKNGKVTKKKLEASLAPLGVKPSYEAFGRVVCAFMSIPAGWTRTAFEGYLERLGCKVDSKWCKDDRTVTSVENISYFKAWHWDE